MEETFCSSEHCRHIHVFQQASKQKKKKDMSQIVIGHSQKCEITINQVEPNPKISQVCRPWLRKHPTLGNAQLIKSTGLPIKVIQNDGMVGQQFLRGFETNNSSLLNKHKSYKTENDICISSIQLTWIYIQTAIQIAWNQETTSTSSRTTKPTNLSVNQHLRSRPMMTLGTWGHDQWFAAKFHHEMGWCDGWWVIITVVSRIPHQNRNNFSHWVGCWNRETCESTFSSGNESLQVRKLLEKTAYPPGN